MRYRDAQLRRRERAREGCVHVAAHDHELGRVLEEHALEGDEREPRLLAVRARADSEEAVRLREAEVVDDLGGETLVVVLAGVHHDLTEEPAPAGRLDDGRHLDEVGPGPTAKTTVVMKRYPAKCDEGSWG